MNVHFKNRSGFTMIELLMVIVIIAVLGAVALPQFLDFRTEGKKAEVQAYLNSMREAIKIQTQNVLLRCNAVSPVKFAPTQLAYNDILNYDPDDVTNYGIVGCSAPQVPRSADRMFIVGSNFAPNTYTNSHANIFSVEQYGDGYLAYWFLPCTGTGCTNHCTPYCGHSAYSNPYPSAGGAYLYGWCMNMNTMEIWAATNVAGECAL